MVKLDEQGQVINEYLTMFFFQTDDYYVFAGAENQELNPKFKRHVQVLIMKTQKEKLR